MTFDRYAKKTNQYSYIWSTLSSLSNASILAIITLQVATSQGKQNNQAFL